MSKRLDLEHARVDMSHGAGGRAMAQLIDEIFVSAFDNPMLAKRNDQALFDVHAGRMVMTTDGYVVSPIFFPGGDIGSLAIHGTINDVAMAGAWPLHLSVAVILEEGFPLADLARVAKSMAGAARAAGVTVVTGDTKVVERGKGDGVFVTTTGVGVVPPRVVGPSCERARAGDVVLVSGTLGDHGTAILASRPGTGFETTIQSDSAALHGLVARMVEVAPDVHVLRDPTRGGLSATLNEIAAASRVGFMLDEEAIPIREEVTGACELLGIDPLHLANEGKLVCVCAEADASAVLDAMRAHPLGRDAAVIGRATEDPHHFVQVRTALGGTRIVDWLAGEALPRIC